MFLLEVFNCTHILSAISVFLKLMADGLVV